MRRPPPLEVLARYTATLGRAGRSRTSIIGDLLFAAAGLALVDGADLDHFTAAAEIAWLRFTESLKRETRS